MKPLRIGLARREVTPPPHLPMDGYADRKGVAQGIFDQLFVRVLYLSQDLHQYCLVSLEALGISDVLAVKLQREIDSSVGIPANHTIIAATHTHSGPTGLASPVLGIPVLQNYLDHIIKQVLEAVKEAYQNAAPSFIQLGAYKTSGIATNRINPGNPIDAHVRVFSFFTKHDRELLGMAIHYACHPTVLGEDNLYYSGDFVGRALQDLERDYGVPCLFLLGAAADVSTRFTRSGRNYHEVSRFANELVIAVKRSLSKPQRVFQDTHLACAYESLPLTKRHFPPLAELAALLQETTAELRHLEGKASTAGQRRHDQTRVLGVRYLLQLARTPGATDPITTTLVALRLGDMILVAIPGEMFQSTAAAIIGYGEKWLPVTLANGYHGYFPTTESIARRDYESLHTPFDDVATKLLAAAIERLIAALSPNQLSEARHYE